MMTTHLHLQCRRNNLKTYCVVAATSISLLGVFLGFAHAQDKAQPKPDTENGRYALSPTPGGIMRLDTRSGVVSACTSVNGNWVCRIVPDERAALDAEIGRLQSENKNLKDQLAQPGVAAAGRTDAIKPKADADKNITIELPFDNAKLMAFLDQVWRRLTEMADRVQKNLSEKI